MTHHAKINWIMFATIVGLVVFLYVRPQSQTMQEYRISSRSIDSVQSVKIVQHGNEIVLEHSAEGWALIHPFQNQIDEKKLAGVLEILSASSHYRFPVTDLAHFGLDQPNIRLYINNDYFGFGGLAPTTNQQYVATNDHIYLISPRYAVMLPSSPVDLIRTKLLATHEAPVKFELDLLTVQLQNKKWHVDTLESGQTLSEKTIEYWVKLWQLADASEVTFEQPVNSLNKGSIRIGLVDGKILNFEILQTESEVILVRVGENIYYHFPIDTGMRLLNPQGISS